MKVVRSFSSVPGFRALVAAVLLGAVADRALGAAEISYAEETDICYRAASAAEGDDYVAQRCLLDVYHPVGQEGFATVVWFHGGALENGDRFLPQAFREQGIAVVAATYRLSPQVECPVYIEDAAAAVAWTFANIGRYGGDPERIYVSGHSAGGYLASMVGLDPRWLEAHGIDANRIAGLLPLSGQTVTHSTVRKEREIPRHRPLIDAFAPLSHARKDAPPLVLVTGDRELDIVARYEENAYLARVMQQVGHAQTELYELQGFNHGTMLEPACQLVVDHIRNAADAD